jgi:lysophospholipase L1-like esterase
MKVKTVLNNFILLLISLTIAIFAAELICRFLSNTNDTDPSYKLEHPVLPFVMKPNSESVSLHGHTIKINSHGLRDFEYSYKKQPDTFRILVLGDSVSYAYGQDMQNGFAKVLERQLNAANSKKYARIEVINASHNGFHILDQYNYLQLYGLGYSPDALVIGVNSSHFAIESLQMIIKDGVDFAPGSLWLRLHVPPWVKRSLRNSYLYMTIGNAYRNHVSRGLNSNDRTTVSEADLKKTTDLTLKKVADDLEKLLSLTSKNSLITYFLYQPNRSETISGAYDAPPLLDQLRSLEKQGRLTFVDSITEFGKYKLNATEIFPVNDGSHPNANGHKIFADRLFDSLIVQLQ